MGAKYYSDSKSYRESGDDQVQRSNFGISSDRSPSSRKVHRKPSVPMLRFRSISAKHNTESDCCQPPFLDKMSYLQREGSKWAVRCKLLCRRRNIGSRGFLRRGSGGCSGMCRKCSRNSLKKEMKYQRAPLKLLLICAPKLLIERTPVFLKC